MRPRISALCLTALLLSGQTRTVTDAEVQRVHRAALLIDTHNDVPWRVVDGFDIGSKSGEWHTDLTRLKAGGLGAVFFVAYVSGDYVEGNRSAHRTLQLIDAIRRDIIGKYPNDFAFATSAGQIEDARKTGKIAALIGIEGGHAIEDDLGLLRQYYNLGARYMTLTHTNTNSWADSSGDATKVGVKHHDGLTDLGKQVVREMNRLGMMVDISHTSDATFADALAVSTAPIIASHSSCRALANHPRNLTDAMIVALAKKGGVVQINFNCGFLSEKFRAAQAAEEPRLEARFKQVTAGKKLSEVEIDGTYQRLRLEMNLTRATLSDVVDHIDHVRKIAGIDAIGIGSDFNGVTCTPQGLDDVSKFPNLTRALLERGYSEADIRKIYGGNLLRVMRAVETAAGK
ncbi:MAG: dipeptidase [Bryobacteraceae bacterium]